MKPGTLVRFKSFGWRIKRNFDTIIHFSDNTIGVVLKTCDEKIKKADRIWSWSDKLNCYMSYRSSENRYLEVLISVNDASEIVLVPENYLYEIHAPA